MTQLAPTPADRRINAIDALRGFALAGIFISHMVEHYVAAIPPPELIGSFSQTSIDQIIFGLTQFLISGKFFALFSFMFGLSFFIQMDHAANKDLDFRGRFIWRLTILLLIGYLHSLFYRGDILTIYAPLGLLLVLFYKVRSNLVLILAAVIIAGAGRYLVFALFGNNTILPFGDADPTLPHNTAYFTALQNGSLGDVFASNAVYGHLMKMQYQIGHIGRWYLTFAFFLLGLWVGRIRLFERLDELRQPIKKTLKLAIASAVVSMILTALLFSLGADEEGAAQFDNWLTMFALTGVDLFNVSLAIVYVCGFLLLYMRPSGERLLIKLAPYGRTALSSYFMQTLIGTFILYNWGLGLMSSLSNTHILLIAVPVLGIQITISAWWLKRFRFGPLEWLWRSLTYLKWQPLRA